MPYVYVDDIAVADMAFRAWEATLEDTFRHISWVVLTGPYAYKVKKLQQGGNL